MKKVLSIFVALVAVVMMTSCEESFNGAEVSIVTNINMHESQCSQETLDNALASKHRIDARLVKMFGKTFIVECKEGSMPTKDDFMKPQSKIENDKTIQKELDYLKTLKTEGGSQAVYSVDYNYMTGDYRHITLEVVL